MTLPASIAAFLAIPERLIALFAAINRILKGFCEISLPGRWFKKFNTFLFILFTGFICSVAAISTVFAQEKIQSAGEKFIFTGNGNWSITSNWLNNKKPPALLASGDTIIIKTLPGDSCVLNITQTLAKASVFQVDSGCLFILRKNISVYIPPDTLFTDPRDGQVYPIKKYGSQTWMTMNLNYKYTGSKVYDNDTANGRIYGRLYNWNQAKNAPPPGWHLPTVQEWNTLINFIGNEGSMKDTLYWKSPNTGATNSNGFNGRPGGLGAGVNFSEMGEGGFWWTATEISVAGEYSYAVYIDMVYYSSSIGRWDENKGEYFSVRCLKNTP